MSGLSLSAKSILFATLLYSAAQAQTLTAAERREQKLHMSWIQRTLAKIGQESAANPPAEILLTYAATGPMTPAEKKQERGQRDWLVHTLKKIRAVQVGSTRAKVLKVFTAEGGIASRTEETFVDRTCPYIKVDVEFRAADPSGRRGHVGQSKLDQNPTDVVTKISTPYLGYMIVD
jgi:hypothetical protein